MEGFANEEIFQDFIVRYLTTQPILDADGKPTSEMEYHEIPAAEYNKPENKDNCLLVSELIAFLKDTQPDEYQKMMDVAEGDEPMVIRSIISRVNSEMNSKLRPATAAQLQSHMDLPQGTLSLLRMDEFNAGLTGRFKLLYTKPANNKTPEHDENYRKNRLAIVRELRYSKQNTNEIDLVVFVNGFPVVSIELKNALTGQTHHNAIKQYMMQRPVKGEKFFEPKRVLVHFAMGTEQVFMTTRLDGENTRFFPFNKVYANQGVTPEDYSGYRTSYMWHDVLRRDNLLDLLQNFLTLQVDTEKVYNPKRRQLEDKVSEALIFPRFHQRRAVHKLIDDVRRRGAGHNYLIQHSAGSGKSNTITWLGFRLSNLFRNPSDDRALFDSILVVTDRRVLNSQLQANFKQFSSVPGELYTIGPQKEADGHTSKDLQMAIENRKRIIITTIQMFPHIADNIRMFPDRKYAVIIDEAHSSQSGEDARQMRKALSLTEAEKFDEAIAEANDNDEKIAVIIDHLVKDDMERKGRKSNVSFFAFTATPKPKTVEIFCEREYGTKEPFDSYTMEQAINEGFILDVMQCYTSFKRYYKLVRDEKKEDKIYDKKNAVRLLADYVDLQDAAIERKSRIMIEHFVSQTANEINGQARAMLVTRSRLHAVRYKLKFDSIMQEMRLPYGALVAFSGTVKDSETGLEYTEVSMNNLQGQVSIPEALKMPQFRILIVANKYQTGFDEPLLQTMFVDKKLGGANAVQTLSRLNRNKRGKEKTFVLDFVNDSEKIRKAFQYYYGKNKMEEEAETDPNSLYDVQSKLLGFGVFAKTDVNRFMRYFLSKKDDERTKVNEVVDEVCDRAIVNLQPDMQDKFRKTCRQFYNLFAFLSQIMPFHDPDLGKLAPFCLAVSKKMPYKKESLPYDVLSESMLQSYKLQYIGTRKLKLESGDTQMKGMKPGNEQTPPPPDLDWLSNIIKALNENFGIDLTDEDRVELTRLREKIDNDKQLGAYFIPQNSRDDVKAKFDETVDAGLLDFINSKFELYNKLTEDRANTLFKNIWFNEMYDRRVRGMK